MAFTRTYIYTRGQDVYRKEAVTIPFTSFQIYSGDTEHRVTRLISASMKLKLYVGTSESATRVGWTGTIQTSGGNFSASSRSATSTGAGRWGQVTVTYDTTEFTAQDFAAITNIISDADYGSTNFEKSNGYLYFTIEFEAEEFHPSISGYTGSRYNGTEPDDLGQQFIYSFTPTTTGTTDESSAEYPSYINFSVGDTVVKTIVDTRTGSTMAQVNALIGAMQSGVISDYTFSIGAGYVVQLNFCYHGELTSASVFIGKSFINFHFSGATDANGDEIGGVAIGQYSSVTRQEGIPKFECNYETHFYKPVVFHAGGGFPKIAFGQISVAQTSSGSYRDTSIDYTDAGFTEPPTVVCGFWSGSTAGTFGRCCVASYNVTETGCTARFYNGDTSARTPQVTWIAIGN